MIDEKKGIFIRGLIELTNYCHNNCYYCGLRRDNKQIERYRLTFDEVMDCCATGYALGIRTFVLQGGEDRKLNDAAVVTLVGRMRREYPDVAITLSLGERSYAAYRSFFEAGADRYLLRHETANKFHYNYLHPPAMSYENRFNCLRYLRDIGYQVGAGMMVGSPGQDDSMLRADLDFLKEFQPEMVGIGPFIPQADTPFGNEPAGSLEKTLEVIAHVRGILPDALIPATTALATLAPDGYIQGIRAGANVIMTNLTPYIYRCKYAIYDNKRAARQKPEEEMNELTRELARTGYYFVVGRGDFIKTENYV